MYAKPKIHCFTLQRRHPAIFASFEASSVKAVPSADQSNLSNHVKIQAPKKWRHDEPGKQQRITKAIVNHIILDLKPLSTVDSSSFRQVLEEAEPSYSMPSRKYVSNHLLPDRHNESLKHLMDSLRQVSQVSLTLDLWSNRQMKSFLGITAHFIHNFNLCSAMLACRRFRGSHTGESILHQYQSIVADFELNGKVHSVITDNASNMTKAFRLLEESQGSLDSDDKEDDCVDEEDILDNVSITDMEDLPTHASCFTHTIQLVIKDGLKNASQINRILGKVSKLVNHVRHSTHASDLFEDELKLQIANATRWNSQLVMLRSLLAVSEETMAKLDYNGKLSAHEINLAKDVVEILSPFEWATMMTQGENDCTASAIVPVVRGTRKTVDELAEKFRSKFTETLQASIKKRLSKYEENKTLQLTSVLDPRWKISWCTSQEAEDLTSILKDKVAAMAPKSEECNPAQPPPKKKQCRFLSYMQFSTTAPQNNIQSSSKQVDEYLSSPSLSDEADSLAFWKGHQDQFPELAKLACEYLHVPASSAPVERLFSVAGKTFRPERCLLSDNRFEQLMFVRSNFKLE